MPHIEEAFKLDLRIAEAEQIARKADLFNALLAAYVATKLEDVHKNGVLYKVSMELAVTTIPRWFGLGHKTKRYTTIEERVLFEIPGVTVGNSIRFFVSGYKELFVDLDGARLVNEPTRIMIEDIEGMGLFEQLTNALSEPTSYDEAIERMTRQGHF